MLGRGGGGREGGRGRREGEGERGKDGGWRGGRKGGRGDVGKRREWSSNGGALLNARPQTRPKIKALCTTTVS